MMGKWSLLAGSVFLEWLAPRSGLTWLDIGCGNGAFTELIAERCAPAGVDAIDPSPAQLAYARGRAGLEAVRFAEGSAMSLPYPDTAFDAVTMALVIFFVPEPAKGLAEMVRVLKPGGLAAAYAWDLARGGFPVNAIWEELIALGSAPVRAPRPEAGNIENLKALWAEAGLENIETKERVVERSFADFEHFWQIAMASSTTASPIQKLDVQSQATLRRRVAARLPTSASGRISYTARANAVKGRRPA
jgi:ubiquinone/menaquinone biosynthesis C-methylase UbiE